MQVIQLAARVNLLKLFFPVICLSIAFQTKAQTCNGALGDPVINETFGAGTNPGAPLPGGTTSMQYVNTNCPNDGQYTISNGIRDSSNCHPYTWFDVLADHTGNPKGYMMIVNASEQPSIFFTEAVNGLCPNTTYQFQAYIGNLCMSNLLTAAYSLPNITFTIQTTTGQVLATTNTGSIPQSSYNQGIQWAPYAVFFTTPSSVTDVVVVMTNNAPGGNGNDFVMDDITFRACGPIIQEGFGSTTGPANQSLCQGASASFLLKAHVIANTTTSYQWQSSSTASPWADIQGATADSITVRFSNAAPNVYQYRLGVSNGQNITDIGCRIYSSPLTVTVNPLPVVPPFGPQSVCEGSTLQLTATGGASYNWTGPNLAPTTKNPLIINNVTPANAGTYTVTAVSDSGCTAAPVQAKVTVVPQIIPGISNSVQICAGESTQLNASGGLYYAWTPSTGLDHNDIPNPVATPLQTTTYTAHISNGGCTDSSKTVTVTVNKNPVANAGNNIVLYEGQSAKLNGSIKGDNITSYYWSPVTFLDDPSSLTPVTTPTDNITYTLTAVSQTCGTSTSSVYVRVYKKVTIPNAFSPNNDGINDLWDIKALNTYPQSTIMVFDRYGKQVFQSIGYAKPWDGTYDGKALPEGTYYYIIDLKDTQPKLSGWVLIIK